MEGEENKGKIILSKSTFKMFVSTFLGCEAALRLSRGSGRGVPGKKGSWVSDFRLVRRQKSARGSWRWAENGVLHPLEWCLWPSGNDSLLSLSLT